MAGKCNLTNWECDEREFEGRAGSAPAMVNLEVLLAVCLGLTGLLLAWNLSLKRQRSLDSRRVSGRRRHARASQHTPGPGPQSAQLQTPTSIATTTATLSPRSPTGGPMSSLSPTTASGGTLRFSTSPGWKPGVRSRSPTLPQAPSGLLQRMSALSQQLRRRTTPVWLLAADQGNKAAAGPPGRSVSPGARYGLGLGEADSADEESDDDLTARELRALQQSPEFHHYLRGRGLTITDVARATRRLRLYRQLRQMDPLGFLLLCRADTTRVFDTQDPTAMALVCEYVLSLASSLAAAAAVHHAWASPAAPAAVRAACLAAAWWLTGAAWVRGRSSGGRLLGMWYEELRWGHLAPGWRAGVAGLLELAYVCGSAGVGAVVSLVLRCRRGRRQGQGVGEMCAGVRLVREVAVSAQQQQGQPEGGE